MIFAKLSLFTLACRLERSFPFLIRKLLCFYILWLSLKTKRLFVKNLVA